MYFILRIYMFRSPRTIFRVPFVTEYVSVKMCMSNIQAFIIVWSEGRILCYMLKMLKFHIC